MRVGSRRSTLAKTTTQAAARHAEYADTKRHFLSASNFSEAELMQYRSPVGFGPSSNTCPKCASHLLHFTSVRFIP